MRAICPGSFDPVTFGHLDIIERAAGMFSDVVVAVGHNMSKTALFTPAERVAMLTECTAGLSGVRATLFSGLLVDYCAAEGIGVIAKGLRSGSDFDYEVQMAQMNRHLAGVETVFWPTAPEWSHVSSSLVREVARLGGDVAALVPEAVADRIRARIGEQTGGDRGPSRPGETGNSTTKTERP